MENALTYEFMTELEFQVSLANHYRGFKIVHYEFNKANPLRGVRGVNPKCNRVLYSTSIPELIKFIDSIYDGEYPEVIISD